MSPSRRAQPEIPHRPAGRQNPWWIAPASIAGVSLGVVAAAVLLAPATSRLMVLGLAALAASLWLGIDWILARNAGADKSYSTQAMVAQAQARQTRLPEQSLELGVPVDGPRAVSAQIAIGVLTRPKAGNTESDNEDGYSVDADLGYVAVSDGASSSVCAREWAAALTSAFTSTRPPFSGKGIRALLQSAATAFTADPTEEAGSWWGEDALRAGAFATLLGFRAERDADVIIWEAAAVGDSVVIQLRPDATGLRMVEGFPLESSASFDGTPNLVGSKLAREGHTPAIRLASGIGRSSDRWLLLTDEVAKWALARAEASRPVWKLLVEGTQGEFERETTTARETGEMENDDLTVVRVRISEAPMRVAPLG